MFLHLSKPPWTPENDPFSDRLATVVKKMVLHDNRKQGYVWVDKPSSPSDFPIPGLHPKKVAFRHTAEI